MPKPVYIASAGLTKVDLTGEVFGDIFDLFHEAYRDAREHAPGLTIEALQVGIMGSEEFEDRANIAAHTADRLGLLDIPAVRSETASSSGAAAFHEAYEKVASGRFDTVAVVAGERMKRVTTEVATRIMSKAIDPLERRFRFTMPGLIALLTRAWLRERGLHGSEVARVLSGLMVRAHALGAANPRAAFHGRRETAEAYFDPGRNLPVATPLMRKDCSPICDGAAAVLLTSTPTDVRVAGLGAATSASSLLGRDRLSGLDGTRLAAAAAYAEAGIRDPRELEHLVLEVHDAFNSLLPVSLVDLGLVDPDDVVAALLPADPALPDPLAHPITGSAGPLPVNLSGGLKARGHPVGGTGLFQIVEGYLQLVGAFPAPEAQVPGAELALAHSIGGPGSNILVTLLERADSQRRRADVARPRPRPRHGARPRVHPGTLDGELAKVEVATTLYVTTDPSDAPLQIAIVQTPVGRMFARLHPDATPVDDESLPGLEVALRAEPGGVLSFRL